MPTFYSLQLWYLAKSKELELDSLSCTYNLNIKFLPDTRVCIIEVNN